MSESLLNDINQFISKYTTINTYNKNYSILKPFAYICVCSIIFVIVYRLYQTNCSSQNCELTNDNLLTDFSLLNAETIAFITFQTISETNTTITGTTTQGNIITTFTSPLIKISTTHYDFDTVQTATFIKNITLGDLVLYKNKTYYNDGGTVVGPIQEIFKIIPSGQGYIKFGN